MRIKNRFNILFNLLVVALLAFACVEHTQDKIIGKWICVEDSSAQIVFAPNGTFSYSKNNDIAKNVTGLYSFIAKNQIKIDFKGGLLGLIGNLFGVSVTCEIDFLDNEFVLNGFPLPYQKNEVSHWHKLAYTVGQK